MANEVRIKLTEAQRSKIKSATGKDMTEIRVGSFGPNPVVTPATKTLTARAQTSRAMNARQQTARAETARQQTARAETARRFRRFGPAARSRRELPDPARGS